MDHHQCISWHNDFIPCHGNHRGNGAGKAVNVNGFLRRVPLQLVIDGSTLKYRAAVTVDIKLDFRNICVFRQLLTEGVCTGFTANHLIRPPIVAVAFHFAVNIDFQYAALLCRLFDFPHVFPILHAYSPPFPSMRCIAPSRVSKFLVTKC